MPNNTQIEPFAPVLSIVGVSNSGKTTLLVKIVAALKERGYRVAVIKHSCGFEVDKPGKDSWRYREVGAGPVVLAGPDEMVLFKAWQEEMGPEEIIRHFGPVDLIITEGYKWDRYPKIEVFRETISEGLIFKPENLLAVVTEARKDWDLPVFSPEDITGLTDFIENLFLKAQK